MSWTMTGTALVVLRAQKSAKRIGFDFGVCRASAIPALGRARLDGMVLSPHLKLVKECGGTPTYMSRSRPLGGHRGVFAWCRAVRAFVLLAASELLRACFGLVAAVFLV